MPARIVAFARDASSGVRAAYTTRTVISFCVSVPGLVGCDDSSRRRASRRRAACGRSRPCLAMRCMPSASVIVVIAGQPLGDRGDREAHRLEQELVPGAAALDDAPPEEHARDAPGRPRGCGCRRSRGASRAASSRRRRWRSSRRFCRARCATPVATTTARPLPRTTVVPMNTIVHAIGERRVVGHGAAARPSGRRALAGQRGLFGARSRSSARGARRPATASPASSSRMSPGTSSAAVTTDDLAAAAHARVRARSCFFSASSAASARRSW